MKTPAHVSRILIPFIVGLVLGRLFCYAGTCQLGNVEKSNFKSFCAQYDHCEQHAHDEPESVVNDLNLQHFSSLHNPKLELSSSTNLVPELPNCPSVLRGSSVSGNVTEFYADFGGNEKRYSYHSYLSGQSTVIEIGGFTGVDINAMRDMFGPFRVLLFEPLFYTKAQQTFMSDDNVEVYPYGIGATTRKVSFAIDGVASKPASTGHGNVSEVEIRKLADVVHEMHIETVDLLQINCEGCEWEVLEELLAGPDIFKHIQVQFHGSASWVPDRLNRYASIQDRLAKRYLLVYDVPWVWQMWKLPA